MGIRKLRLARRAALFATFVAFALATGALPSPAAAKPGGGHRSAGVFGYLLGYRPYYARGAYYPPRRRAYLPRFRPDRPYYKPAAHRGYGRACHSVSKVGYDGYGRKAKIGGTMCYDSYGNSYVVKGSRYVIHYYQY